MASTVLELSRIDVRDGCKLDLPAAMNLGSNNTKSISAKGDTVSIEYDHSTRLVHVQIVSPNADRDYFVPVECVAIMYPARKR